MDPKGYWVGLNMVKGIGSVRLRALLNFFGDAQTAWNAPVDGLKAAGLNPRIIESLLKIRHEVNLERVMTQLEDLGIQVITWQEETYPRRLKEINQPPPVLYLRGDLLPQDELAVAVVGTRRVSGYGRQVTEEIADLLGRKGVTVVSGLARGVDGIAHHAALQADGRTIAVMGCGVDQIYPPEHRQLAAQVMAHGALISDYPPGTPPDSINFPPRNRIISGLAIATVIVEAGETSGALITATFAAEQGREVFAVPGNIYALQSKGTNRLIQQGARPLLDVGEILEVLDMNQVLQQQTARSVLPADALEACILQVLGPEPLHVDEIWLQSGLPIDKVSATLAIMELKGMVRQLGGMNYVAVREIHQEYQIHDDA